MKFSIILSACILSAGIASAQSKTAFGIRGALNLSNFSYSGTSVGTTSLVGFAGGIFVEAPIAGQFALQPELDYSTKGAKFGTDKTTLSYLALPILFKYVPTAVKGLNVFLGPEVDYLLSAKDKSSDGTTDVKSSLKSIDAGLDIGAGYDFLPNLGVDLRYGIGLVNLVKSTEGTGSVKNGTFQFGVRYIFGR